MIIDIEGIHGFVVQGPSTKYPEQGYAVMLPIDDGEIVWHLDKEKAIKEMGNFIQEAQLALKALYGFPGGGGTSPPLRVVEDPAPLVPAGQMTLADAA